MPYYGGGHLVIAGGLATLADVAALQASTHAPFGAGAVWRAGTYEFVEASTGASDHHITTAGGVKLYARPSDGSISLAQLGANASTTDILSLLTTAATLAKRIIIPYRVAAWPLLSTWTQSDVTLHFERGARISFDMATTPGMALTSCTLTGDPSFTSIFTGPTSAGDYGNYGLPARELLLHTGCRVEGTLYKEYSTSGIHLDGPHVTIGAVIIKHIRHRTGWGSPIHIDNANAYDIRIGHVYIEDADRGIEIEAGSHDITFFAGGHLKNIYPNGYTGQPSNSSNADGAAYAGYTAVLDGHTHSGEGGVSNLTFQGEWLLEDCGQGVTFSRATGSNDSDLPRNCHVDTLHMKGRTFAGTSGTDSIQLEGYSCGIGKLHMEVGGGVSASSRYRIIMKNGTGAYLGQLLAESFDVPMLEIQSTMTGATVGPIRVLDGKVSGAGYLIDISGPYTKLQRVDTLAVGNGNTGYIRFQATADSSQLDTFNWTKKGSDTWTDPYVDLSQNTRIGFAGSAPLIGTNVGRAGKFLSLPNRLPSSNQFSNQVLRTTPVFIPQPITIDQLGVEIVTAGEAGSSMRLGIFDDASGLPGDPLTDVVVSASTIATPMGTVSPSLTLLRGWYHFGGVPQNAPTTGPFVRSTTAATDDYPIFSTSTPATRPVGYSKAGVSGALSNYGTSVVNTNVAPCLWVRLTD